MAYINKIDILIDESLNNFYIKYIANNKDSFFSKIPKERNFTQFQLKINKYIDEFMSTIKEKDIEKIVNSPENIVRIIIIIKRYIAYYVYLMIGYFYQHDKDNFTKNIIEIMMNQSQYNFKIENFFNSENNATLFKFFNLIKDIQFILDIKDIKKSVLITPQGQEKYKNALLLLQSFDKDFIENNLKSKDHFINAHNLIKIIVFKILYQTQEKIDVMRILEDIEKEKSKYTYIKIVISKRKMIDYYAIERLLTPNEIRRGVALEIYNMIKEQETKEDISYDDRILELINSKILVPISEDFLRYHKDTEKYLYNVDKLNFKKDDTKIKYIVTKLDAVADYYSDNVRNNEAKRKEIEKLFYAPLSDMKAVLINDTEEITIINKIIKQNKPVEFFSDLLNYSRYPYVNFKNFKTVGISVPCTDTIDVVRSTSFEHIKNVPLQLRVGAEEQLLNIVGFLLFDPKVNTLDCLKSNKVTNIRTQYSNITNGVEGIMKYMKDKVFSNNNYDPVYWLFDIVLDTFSDSLRDNVNNVDYQKKIKYNLSKLYDQIQNSIYEMIKQKISNMSFYSTTGAREIINNVTQKYFRISTKYLSMLERQIMYENQVTNIEDPYVEESKLLPIEDPVHVKRFFDRSADIHTVTCCAISEVKQNVVEEIGYVDELVPENSDNVLQDIVENNSNNYNNAICQHIVTWNSIVSLRKKNPNLLQKLLYDFIQQYVSLTTDSEYVCKSCGIILDIKNYVPDGVYDDAEGRFKLFSISVNVPMNDIPEYDVVIKSVKTMDKILEKICSIANIPYYVGSQSSIKWRRQNLDKTIIDMMIVHNRVMKPIYKERNEKAPKLYGVSRSLSNLYFFDVDNNIFTYSSKEKDYYKLIKGNNAITYILIMLFLELNESFILNMGIDKRMKIDKQCNIHEYNSHGSAMLEDLKIIINNKGDTEYISKYPILAYCIYYFSCILTKYKLWYVVETKTAETKTNESQMNRVHGYKSTTSTNGMEYKSTTSTNGMEYKSSFRSFLRGGAVVKDFNINMQKMIIHTIVDMLNSILEINMRKNKNYIYDVFSSHFFKTLDTLFKNAELYGKLINKYESEQGTVVKKAEFKLVKKPEVETIPLTGTYVSVYDDPKMITAYARSMPSPLLKYADYYRPEVNIARNDGKTHCITGEYHLWSVGDTLAKCKRCGKTSEDIIKPQDGKETKTIFDKTMILSLQHTAKVYCPTGQKHNFVNDICKLCGKKRDEKYTANELHSLYTNSEKLIAQLMTKQLREQQQNDKDIKEYESLNKKLLKELKTEYGTIDNISGLLITSIEGTVGKTVGNTPVIANTSLTHNTYIIDHDYLGNLLAKPNIISEQSLKIYHNTNHNYFKTNVMYFNDKSSNNIEVYYDTISNVYLGYRKNNREYVNADPSKPKYILINYSVSKQLELLGYSTLYIKNKPNTISRTQELRIFRLKNIIKMTQRILNRLAYSEEPVKVQYDNPYPAEVIDTIVDTSSVLIEKYRSQLSNININNVFVDWENVIQLYVERYTFTTNNDPLVSVLELKNELGDVLLYYITRELIKLINDNKTQRNKVFIVNLVMDIILTMYNYYNTDLYRNNIEVRKFKYIMRSTRYIHEVESAANENTHIVGPYEEDLSQEELEQEQAENEDAKESSDALDIENMGELENDGEGLRDFANAEDRD